MRRVFFLLKLTKINQRIIMRNMIESNSKPENEREMFPTFKQAAEDFSKQSKLTLEHVRERFRKNKEQLARMEKDAASTKQT